MSTLRQQIAGGLSESRDLMDRLQQDTIHFDKLSQLLKEHAGINMVHNDKNLTLMASRLSSVLRSHGLASYKEYISFLKSGQSGVMTEFVSALTTNTTQFFRESAHFDILREKIADMIQLKRQAHSLEVRFWCAASSTGQEVYTLMMVLMEELENKGNWDIKFLASDIDLEVLDRAAQGIYTDTEMSGIPESYRKKYFSSIGNPTLKQFRIRPIVREKIRFAQFNLLTSSFPFQHPFDFVFCRNVLIYFDRPTCEAVIEKMAKSLGTSGHLFLGHSETGMMRSKLLKTVANGVYEKIGKAK